MLEFTVFTLAAVATVVRTVHKTRVTLANIFRVSIDLIKRLIFVMFSVMICIFN